MLPRYRKPKPNPRSKPVRAQSLKTYVRNSVPKLCDRQQRPQ